MSLSRISAAAIAALTLALASCRGEESPAVGREVALVRITPHALDATGGADAAWALFDRDTATGWTPPPQAGGADVTAHLDNSAELTALKVFGQSPYRLWVLDAQGAPLSGPHDLSTLAGGWTLIPVHVQQRVEQVTLRFAPIGSGGGAVPEVELWGTTVALPVAWEPAASPGAEELLAPLVEVVPAATGTQELSRDPGSDLAGCGTFSFDLTRYPGAYRRAWLRYRAEGVFRPLALTRVVNGSAMMRGLWVPPTSNDPVSFVHPLDPESLRLGHNQIEFCLPGESRGKVTLGKVELVAELDHGSNVVESISLAPIDAVPTQSADSLLRGGGEAVTVGAGQEMVIAFERWLAPDGFRIGSNSGVTWSARCVGADGAARELPTSHLDEAAGTTIYKVEGAGQPRCAGLRLRPSAEAQVTRLRVFGSGTDRRIDFPRIVLASPREHFGQEAWVDGWASAPSRVGGGVLVSIDGRQTDSTTGVFASLIQRNTDASAQWPVTLSARFADGSTFTRQFVLDRPAGTLPGAETRVSAMDDGLSADERHARYGDVGQIAQADLAPGQAGHIQLGTHVSLDVPADAMQGRKQVSIKHLDPSAIPPLDPGLINVTAPFRHAYEFQPHHELFNNALKITLPYQPSLIPAGYVPEDIQTFYYDDTAKRWEPLTRAQVRQDLGVVDSLTDHFTIMINAIVVTPEHPQVASFDPNRLKGMKAATPAAGIQLIAPPEANSRGETTLHYPLEVPPGRLGVQPSFALGYSSGRGNGWVGLGWDLGASAIEVETRWGVPRYDAAFETETYLLDGAQLSPTAHRAQPRPRGEGTTPIDTGQARLFHPRVEGGFQRVARLGDGPSRYWWEVTDRKGTRYFYGGTPETGRDAAACLTDDAGNVFRWALREIRDTHGNRVRFNYDAVTWSAPGQVPGRELYLASAHYTLRAGETEAPYRVVFLREPACASEGQTGCRPDLIVSGRGGFKQVTGERLRRVEVYFHQTLVRAWELQYDQGPFGKSRLRRLVQFGVDNRPFPGNEHSFDYFDEVSEGPGVYHGFAQVESWNAGSENPDTGLVVPDVFYNAIGAADASALGGTRTRSVGGHLYTGVTFGSPDKWTSVGVKVGRRSDFSDGRAALVDVDGDGLADRVFQGAGGGFFFNRNQSGPSGPASFATPALPVTGLPALSRERSEMSLSFGAEAYVAPVQALTNVAYSSAQQDTFLSDVNADGLVDLVKGSTVYFNSPGADGLPRFVAGDSSGTPVRIGASAVSRDVLPPSFEDPAATANLDHQAPPVDTVRTWEAPYDGRVRVSGEVALVQAQRPGADGLRVTIERAGVQLWEHTFGPAETQPQNPSVELNVAAGDRLYFRLHMLHNEWDDRVRWSPVVQYLDMTPAQDENLLNVHRFEAANEFVLAGRRNVGMNVPFAGTVQVSGRLTKLRETTDDVSVTLLVDGNTAFSYVFPAAGQGSVDLARDLAVSAKSFVALRIHSDSPIDLTALKFDPIDDGSGGVRYGPWLRYTAARDENGGSLPVQDPQGNPLFEVPLPYDMTTYSLRSPAMPAPPFMSLTDRVLRVTARVDAGSTPYKGKVTFTVKSRGHLVGKQQVDIQNGGNHQMVLDVPLEASVPVFFSISVDNPDLYRVIQTSVTGDSRDLPYLRYGLAGATQFPHAYRGWSYGGYNGAGEQGDQPIPSGVLEAPPIFDGSETFNEQTAPALAQRYADEGMKAFPFFPMPDTMPCRTPGDDGLDCSRVRGGHWRGPHDLVYVTATEMSTTRLGGPVARLPAPEQLAGATAVPRLSRSQNTAFGAGAGPFSFSQSQGDSHGLLDFIDMNGDGFPDVVAQENIQYTSPLGVLAERRGVSGRDLRTTSSQNTTQGVGGNLATGISDARALLSGGSDKDSDGFAGTQQMQPVGFILNVGASEGSASSEADLMDVNGDGLPDRVWKGGGGRLEVALNLGYRFADREPWGQGLIHEGNTEELNGGASLSFNSGNYGFGGGLNGSRSDSSTRTGSGGCGGSLLDVNGDGLIDCVERSNDGLRVWFNLGHRLSSTPVSWRGGAGGQDLSKSRTTTLGGGVYFSISIGIGIVGVIINPGADFGESISRPTTSIQDIDGDGYPDQLMSGDPHQISVARNRTGRTNLLRHVKRPLGAEMWFDYTRAGNTRDMPHSRWVLSEVKVYDGQADSAELGQATDYTLQRISYAGGRYERYEREFYGFAQVSVDQVDTRGWDGAASSSALPVYRHQELTYLNTSYPERGLLVASRMLGGDGAVYERATYQYELRDATTGRVLAPAQVAQTEAVFPAQVQEHHYRHEGDPNASIHTFTTQDYDIYGNVIRLYDAGGPGPGDDYRAEMLYTARYPACVARYIVGVADQITVSDAAGALLRKREATVDCASGTGDVRQIRVSLDSTSVAQTDLSYDGDGNLETVTAPPNRNGQRYELRYTYDPEVRTHVIRMEDSFGYYSTAGYDLRFGLPVNETDLNGNSVLTDYDDFGRVSRVRGPYEIERGLDYAIRFAYSPDAPVPFATTAHMDVFRDAADPIETVTFVDGLGRALQTKKDATLHRGPDNPAQDAVIVSGRVHFDPWGRVIARWFPTEEPKSDLAFTRPVDPSAPPTRITYDVLDREVDTVLPDSTETRVAYSLAPALAGGGLWQLTQTIDAEGKRREAYHDPRENIAAVVEYLAGRGITTRYEYDALKQIRRVIDAKGNVTRSEYDLAGRRTDVVQPDSGRTQLVYEPAGNVIRKITANVRRTGGAVEYQYDFTHLVQIQYPGFADNNVTYAWGGAALRGQPGNRVGRITRVDDNSGFEERQYGALGEIVYERRSIDSHTMGSSANSPEIYVTRYLYDTWGRLQQMIYPDTEVLTYAYDSGGQPRAVAGVKLGTRFPYMTRLEYDRFEQRAFMQLGNGIRSYYTYDPRSRRLDTLEAGEFQRLKYGYDKVGNVTSLLNDVPNARPNEYGGRMQESFVYDDLYRLTNATGTWFQPPGKQNQYTYILQYDDIHNILSKDQHHWIRNRGGGKDIDQHKTTYAWQYDYGSSKPHAPTHIGDRTFFYDDNGNQTGWDDDRSGQRRNIVWDEENRIRSISDNGHTTRFVYDDAGTRVIKTGAQGETVYVNDKWTVRNRSVGTKHVYVGSSRIASKLSPGDAHVRPDEHDLITVMLGKWWEHRSTSGNDHGQNVDKNPHYAQPSEMPGDGMPDTNFLYFYHPDHVGSTSYVTDVDGELYEHVEYFPSGETWVDQRSNTERLPYLFSGKELDQETGLYYFGARYYDPRVGLWASTDPHLLDDNAFHPGSSKQHSLILAAYTYANANPLAFIDPDGREPNKAQAITWDDAKKIIISSGGKSGATLDGLRYVDGDAHGAKVGPFGGDKGGRYIWTEKRGWIDLGHFFQVAAKSKDKIGTGWTKSLAQGPMRSYTNNQLREKTIAVEDSQKGTESYWSYEDPSSNQAGLDFFLDYYKDDAHLISSLDEFFKAAGAKKPEDAPNWRGMQQNPQKKHWFEQAIHGSMDPVLLPKKLKKPE